MPESLALSQTARAALERIVDYAGLFPPAQLPMEPAADEYERARSGPHAWMLGRFVVPVAKLDALDASLHGSEPVRASVLLDAEHAIHATPRVRPESGEIALRLASQQIGEARTAVRALCKGLEALAPGLPLVIEVPHGLPSALLAETADALAQHGVAAKIRCGGKTADMTPSTEAVADFVLAMTRDHVPFKATAGLHHPVRHFNAAAGFTMHGFLNVLAAACAAPRFDVAMLREIVADEDPSSFAFDDEGFRWQGTLLARPHELAQLRERAFSSFGSCSFAEPVDDLVALGIVPAA